MNGWIFHVDFSKFRGWRLFWGVVAVISLVIGAYLFFGHTAPKLMGSGEDAGASPMDLLGPAGTLIGCVFAVFKACMARDPLEIVNSVKALAENPVSQQLLQRFETAFLAKLLEAHKDHPNVQAAIANLGLELARVNFPPPNTPPQLSVVG